MKILLIMLSISFLGFAGQKRDSRIYGPDYSEIVRSLEKLSIDYPKNAKLIQYGKGEAGNDLYGIFIKDETIKTTKVSLITGAHHGNEYLNIADRLPELILNDIKSNSKNFKSYIQSGGSFFIAPIINPYGYQERTRANSRTQDLNRDYPLIGKPNTGFQHSEVRDLDLFIKSKLNSLNAKLVFTLDYHCCNGARGKGAVIWTNNFDREKSRKKMYFKMRDILKSNLSGLTAGTAMDIVGYDPKGTSNDYWDNYFGAYSLVFEGQQGKEDKKLKKHYKSLADIFTLF